MITRLRPAAAATAVALLAVPALLAGCSSSSGSKASPLPAPTTTVPVRTTPTTAAASRVPAALAAQLHQQLQGAGSDIDGAGDSITNSDVDRAKAQEGSAP